MLRKMRDWSAARAAPRPGHGRALVGDGGAIVLAMFGPRHPGEPALLAALQAYTRAQKMRGLAQAFPALAERVAILVDADRARIREALPALRRALREAPLDLAPGAGGAPGKPFHSPRRTA